MTRLNSILVLTFLSSIAVTAGCKLSTTGLAPFRSGGGTSGGANGSSGAGATGGGPVSTEAVQPIASTCDGDARTPAEIADGVPPLSCAAAAARSNDPAMAEQADWYRRKRFIRPTVPADPGRAKVGRYRAPWCDGKQLEGGSASGLVAIVANGDPSRAHPVSVFEYMPNAVRDLCTDPDDPRFQDLAGAYMQRWVNETGASVETITAYLARSLDPDLRTREDDETCARWADLSGGGLSERDQALAAMTAKVFGCSTAFISATTWHLDALAEAPVLATMGSTYRCLGADDPSAIEAATVYAMCRPATANLDAAKLDAELAAGQFNATAKAVAKLRFEMLRAQLAVADAGLEKAVGSDADLRAVLIEAPAQAWKAWVDLYQRNRAQFDAARAYEAKYYGNSKSAKRGCLGAAVDGFAGYVRASSWKTVDEMAAVATDPVGAVLAEHVRSCLEAEGDTQGESLMRALIGAGLPRRGPRFAVVVAMQAALAKVLNDRERFAIDPQWLAVDAGNAVTGSGFQHRASADNQGVVATVEAKGARVVLSFKVETWSEDEYACTETNKILGWRPDGTVMYRQDCRQTGRKVKRQSQAYSFHMPKELAAGIKPGVFVVFTTGADYQDKVFDGAAVEVWSDKDRKRLIAAYGVLAP